MANYNIMRVPPDELIKLSREFHALASEQEEIIDRSLDFSKKLSACWEGAQTENMVHQIQADLQVCRQFQKTLLEISDELKDLANKYTEAERLCWGQ